MGWEDPDPYYQPEHFGLTPVVELEPEGQSYSFDLFVVWQHEDGSFYWGADTGCSCPAPYEDVHSLDDLEHGDARAAYAAVESWAADHWDREHIDPADLTQALAKLAAA